MLLAYKVVSGINIDLDDMQIEGIYSIVRNLKKRDNDKNRLYYMIATAYHESRLRPIQEYRARIGTELRERKSKHIDRKVDGGIKWSLVICWAANI